MSIDIPSKEDFAELTKHRQAGSVSIYLAASDSGTSDSRQAIVHDSEAAQIALRAAANKVRNELAASGVERNNLNLISEAIQTLEDDREFWGTQARSIAIFVSPEKMHVFRLMNKLPAHTAIGDRFDVGPLLRATTFGHSGYVLAITEGDVRLLHLASDATSRLIELSTLPTDAAEALDIAVTTGRFNRHKADGTLGPKTEQRRYCTIVQKAVLQIIENQTLPMVLAVASDLEPAYREINTYGGLLHRGIDANPSSLSLQDLETRGRELIEEHFAAELAEWRENFGSLRANGRASSQITDIARAASAGLVDTLFFDLESHDEGIIDDFGVISFAEGAGTSTYGLVDEIASRVLRTGGIVKAVRRDDLPDDSSVAATFRSGI